VRRLDSREGRAIVSGGPLEVTAGRPRRSGSGAQHPIDRRSDESTAMRALA